MELPPTLRLAVDQVLEGVSTAQLAAATQALSQRYRNEVRDGRLHLSDQLAAQAYIATRMPATYAAIYTSLAAAAGRLPDLSPTTLLDIGAGPGTALWATLSVWPQLQSATLIETSPAIRAVGQKLAAFALGITGRQRRLEFRNGHDADPKRQAGGTPEFGQAPRRGIRPGHDVEPVRAVGIGDEPRIARESKGDTPEHG